MPKTVNRQVELRDLLEQLNLGGMAAIFAEVALRAAKEPLTHQAYLWELAARERDQRTQRRTARLLRASGLPAEKTFRTFDLGKLPAVIQAQVERLRSGAFLESATGVVAVGRPGVGKTHLSQALADRALSAGYSVLFTTLADLARTLESASHPGLVRQRLRRYIVPSLLVIDEVGYTWLSQVVNALPCEQVLPSNMGNGPEC